MCVYICHVHADHSTTEMKIKEDTNRKNCIQVYEKKLKFLLLLSVAVRHYSFQIRVCLGTPSQAKVKPQTEEQILQKMKFTETLDVGEYNWKTILAVRFHKDKTSD